MNRRILIVDDTKGIHEDFRKILASGGSGTSDLASARAAFFGEPSPATSAGTQAAAKAKADYDLTFCFQGLEALEVAKKSLDDSQPFAMAFVDVRMPPGIDGVQTIKRLWDIDPNLQCVICSAFSDYSWEQMIQELGHTDKLLILKKPFDPTEICQIASAFTEKWNAASREQKAIEIISQKEIEARAYASSLETLNKALATAKASADRTSAMKSDFIMRLTTEMSSHLNAILDRLIESDEVNGLDDALERSQRLLGMINKVIDFTQVDLGSLVLTDQSCVVRDFMGGLRDSHVEAATAKGLDLRLEIAPAVPEVILTDAHRLQQVLTYLIENAIQYTDSGSVEIRLLREPTGSWDSVKLRFEVEDTGCGVNGELSGKIFEPFAGSKDGSFMDGSGLGLTVATRVARVMGGEVSFDSSTDVGTTFTLELEVKPGGC